MTINDPCLPQVSQNGLDILGFLIDRLASDFRPYLNTVMASQGHMDRFMGQDQDLYFTLFYLDTQTYDKVLSF